MGAPQQFAAPSTSGVVALFAVVVAVVTVAVLATLHHDCRTILRKKQNLLFIVGLLAAFDYLLRGPDASLSHSLETHGFPALASLAAFLTGELPFPDPFMPPSRDDYCRLDSCATFSL